MSQPHDPPAEPTGLATQDHEAEAAEKSRFTLIVNYMVPVLLPSAGNNPVLARQAAIQALDDSEAATLPEADALARAICLDHAAMDSLGKSMSPDLTENQRIRYRNQAVSLTRSAEGARRTFDALRDRRLTRRSYEMADAFYPPDSQQAPEPEAPAAPASTDQPPPSRPRMPTSADPETAAILADRVVFPLGLQAMQRASRAMLADFDSLLADPGPRPEVPPIAHGFGKNGFRPDRPAA